MTAADYGGGEMKLFLQNWNLLSQVEAKLLAAISYNIHTYILISHCYGS
jgi:hypothetical protein